MSLCAIRFGVFSVRLADPAQLEWMLGHHPGVGRRSGTMEGGLKRCPFKAMANDYHVVGSVVAFFHVGMGLELGWYSVVSQKSMKMRRKF